MPGDSSDEWDDKDFSSISGVLAAVVVEFDSGTVYKTNKIIFQLFSPKLLQGNPHPLNFAVHVQLYICTWGHSI